MKHLLVVAVAALAACGDAPDRPTASGESESAPSDVVFADGLGDTPCELLPPEAVSEAVSVPADQLELSEILGACRYSWDGGTAELGRLTILDSPADARHRFENAYRTLTADDRTRGEAGMRDELDRREDDGDLTEAGRETADAVGGTIADLAAATVYEPVADLGDQAVYDGTVHTIEGGVIGEVTTAESWLHVRRGNLIASVAADLFDPGDDLAARKAGPPPEARRRNREVTLALGHAVLDRLGDRAGS